jgi:hypothetical protein
MLTYMTLCFTRYYFHLMACAIIYCVTLQDDLLTTGANNTTRAKHLSISLSCGQSLLLVSLHANLCHSGYNCRQGDWHKAPVCQAMNPIASLVKSQVLTALLFVPL